MEQLLSGIGIKEIPEILETYLFCSPALDLNFRCLPKDGGYYNQDYVDILAFKIIEGRILDKAKRDESIRKAGLRTKTK